MRDTRSAVEFMEWLETKKKQILNQVHPIPGLELRRPPTQVLT